MTDVRQASNFGIPGAGGMRPPMYQKLATVMAQVSEGYWEMGRVLSHEVATLPDGRMAYRYSVGFIGSRVFNFLEHELCRPEDVVRQG